MNLDRKYIYLGVIIFFVVSLIFINQMKEPELYSVKDAVISGHPAKAIDVYNFPDSEPVGEDGVCETNTITMDKTKFY